MSNNLTGTIHTKKDNKIIVKYLDNEYEVLDSDELKFEEGSKVKFSLEKKIFSDKIEIFAKIINSNNLTWDLIFKDFIKNNSNFSLSSFQQFLKINYEVPKILK